MATAVAEQQTWKRFTAVDLVTLAVFAALYRALWYFWHALGFLWPFNQVFSSGFYVLCGVAAVLIVRKVGAMSLYAVASQIINIFLQGEIFASAVIMAAAGVFADVYYYFRVRGGADPFTTFKDQFIAGGILMAVWWSVLNWYYVFPVMYAVDLPTMTVLAAAIACIAGGMLGAWAGYALGGRLKGLVA